MRRHPTRLVSLLAWSVCALAVTPLWAQQGQAPSCQAVSGPKPPAVVELYTSEGCSSCPPADRWLSGLKNQDGVLALAFHVSYWNHLGWLDRFATKETTERQYQIKAAIGGKNVYTPQVVLNGQDHRNWNGDSARSLARLSPERAPVLRLTRTGNLVTAEVAATDAHKSLAGYWAVLQDGLASKVTRGENAGENLKHDHVVSHYQPVQPWASSQAKTLQLDVPLAAQQRVVFVVTDPGLTRPFQALALSCS